MRPATCYSSRTAAFAPRGAVALRSRDPKGSVSNVIHGFVVMRRRTTMLNEMKPFVAQRTDELLLFRRRAGVVPFAGRGSAASVRRGYDLTCDPCAAPGNASEPTEGARG